MGSIPGLGRSLGGGNGNPVQYSCLENSMDRGAWWAIVHGVAKSWTQLSDVTISYYPQVSNLPYKGQKGKNSIYKDKLPNLHL